MVWATLHLVWGTFELLSVYLCFCLCVFQDGDFHIARISVKPEVAKQMTDNDLLLLTKDHPQDENCRWGVLQAGLLGQSATGHPCGCIMTGLCTADIVQACCSSTGPCPQRLTHCQRCSRAVVAHVCCTMRVSSLLLFGDAASC